MTERLRSLDFKPSGLAEKASETLCQAILEGVLKGGEQLLEVQLQRQLGISRSPLREAFRDLEKKGLVVMVPRKGTFVKTVSRKDVRDNFPVRAVLEGLAARMAYKNMANKERAALNQALENMKRSAKAEDAKGFMEHHIVFHETFIHASKNDVLIKVLENLRMHSMWYRFSYQYYKEDFQKSLSVHRKILTLFSKKDSDEEEIERMVREHIEVALEKFLIYLGEQIHTV